LFEEAGISTTLREVSIIGSIIGYIGRSEAQSQCIGRVGEGGRPTTTGGHGGHVAIGESSQSHIGPCRVILHAKAITNQLVILGTRFLTAYAAALAFGRLVVAHLILRVVCLVTGAKEVFGTIPQAAPETLILQVIVGVYGEVGAISLIVVGHFLLHIGDCFL